MSSKSSKKAASSVAAAAAPAAAPAAAASRKQARAAEQSDDDADFHDLPKETQPKKKHKKAAAVAPVPNLDPEAAAASAAHASAAQTKKAAAAAASVAAAATSATRKNGGKLATVPLVGGAGDDDEAMDSGDERDGSDDEGKAVVKTLTKTQIKEARFWDRPAVSAASLLPDPNARTPSHTKIAAGAGTASTSSSAAAAAPQLLQPLAAIPSALTAPISKSNPSTRKVIIVLVKASLETVKTKKGYELISADSHKFILGKLKKNPSEYRPDILHQCLLTLLDSPLNKAGMLSVFVQTEKGVLIEIHPSIRIPRTFKRFAGLMVQLLHKLKIRSNDSSDMLLKVIRNPITDHLPIGSLKIGTSVLGDLVDIRELAANVIGINPTAPVVFCVGSHASGPAEVNWTDKSIAMSKYPLSASVALGRIMNAFEGIWGVL